MPSTEIHWADLAAENLIKRQNKKKYVCAAGITPSGTVHIGNFREVITVDLVQRALKDRKKTVRFLYSWDDYDVFRKVPKNMPKPEVLEKFLRHPIMDTPDTFGCHTSYAEHNEKEFEQMLPAVDIHPEFIHQAQHYRKCVYAKEIRIALQNRERIIAILNKYREEPLEKDWYPASIFCEKCGTDETKITTYDEEFKVGYACGACKFTDTFDIRKKGIIKLVWRVDWPMRWRYEQVDFEPGGKDHSTAGGSYDTGKEIVKVYDWEAPFYVMYDFITIKGKGGKISSSSGEVITLKEVLEVYEPEVVRWLFASTRPNTEFAISFDLDILTIYEEFDKNERLYFGDEKAETSKDLVAKEKRMYELSMMELPKKLPVQPPIRDIINLVQVYEFDVKKVGSILEEEAKNAFDKRRIKNRVECIANWVKKYAPEEFKFRLNNEPPQRKWSEHEKKAVHAIVEVLQQKKHTGEELHQEFYKIMQDTGLETKAFFTMMYQVLISKEKGPKLAGFINVIGAKRVIAVLSKVK